MLERLPLPPGQVAMCERLGGVDRVDLRVYFQPVDDGILFVVSSHLPRLVSMHVSEPPPSPVIVRAPTDDECSQVLAEIAPGRGFEPSLHFYGDPRCRGFREVTHA